MYSYRMYVYVAIFVHKRLCNIHIYLVPHTNASHVIMPSLLCHLDFVSRIDLPRPHNTIQ